jgi:(2Fe-2S) ferredoxin
MPGYERHIFVCENARPDGHPRGCCAARGAGAVRARFRQLVQEHGVSSRVRANMAGCLDQCEHGVTIVVYPEGVWYGGVTVEDVDEIFTRHILGGEIVERCRLAPQSPPGA